VTAYELSKAADRQCVIPPAEIQIGRLVEISRRRLGAGSRIGERHRPTPRDRGRPRRHRRDAGSRLGHAGPALPRDDSLIDRVDPRRQRGERVGQGLTFAPGGEAVEARRQCLDPRRQPAQHRRKRVQTLREHDALARRFRSLVPDEPGQFDPDGFVLLPGKLQAGSEPVDHAWPLVEVTAALAGRDRAGAGAAHQECDQEHRQQRR
jgi:hypothetical protein